MKIKTKSWGPVGGVRVVMYEELKLCPGLVGGGRGLGPGGVVEGEGWLAARLGVGVI